MKKITFFLVAILLTGVYFMSAGGKPQTLPRQASSLSLLAAENSASGEYNAAKNLAVTFGQRIQNVTLSNPAPTVVEYMRRYYGDLLTPELLARWQLCQDIASGRTSTSSWPDRIDISNVRKVNDNTYEITGKLIEVSEYQVLHGGVAARRSISLTVSRYGGDWLISDGTLGPYEDISVKTGAFTGSVNPE